MKRFFSTRLALPALLIVLAAASPSPAQEAAVSSAEDKARALELVKHLEDDPLASDAEEARQWLTSFIVNAPDLFISTCPELLGPLNGQGKNGANELVGHLYFGNAAWVLQNPEKASEREEMYAGGIESALRVYQSLLKAKPRWRWPLLDKLRSRSKEGTLVEFVRENISVCQ